jgi:hypothetical protein
MLTLRRIVTFFIISAIVWNSGGYYFYFKVLQAGIREEMEREAMKAEECDLIPIEFSFENFAGIIWVKKDKEFIRDGELYDVVRILKSDRSVTLYCINDTREKQLLADFHKSSGVDAGLDRIARILHKLAIPVSVNQNNLKQTTLYSEGNILFRVNYSDTCNGFTRVITPPPDKVSQISLS